MPETTTEPSAATTTYRGLFGRVLGILTAPRSTYPEVIVQPSFLGALLLVLAITVGASFAFLSTAVGEDALLDQQMQFLDSFGMQMPTEAYDRMEAGIGTAKYYGAVFQTIGAVLFSAVIAGFLLVIFNFGLGGNATFRQLFAVVVHAGVVFIVQALFVTPLNYAKGSLSGATNLGVFVPFLSDTSFAARLLGAIDLFIVWWIVNLAIGVAVLYGKRTAPIAWSFLAVYAGIALVIALGRSLFAGA